MTILTIGGLVNAQYNDIDVTSMSRDILPEAVLKDHTRRFPNVIDIEWTKQTARFIAQDGGSFYVVRFKKDGHSGHKSFYDSQNNFVAYVGHVAAFSLPDPVKDQATTALSDSYIKAGEIIELGNPSLFIYRVRVHSEGYLRYIYFDKYGNQIDKRNLHPSVFSFI